MNAVILSFDPNENQSVTCERKQFNYETYRAVESDSVKSARKAKGKFTRPVKERQKLVSKLCMGRNKTECAWQA